MGKLFGMARATKGGLGTATVNLSRGVKVSALAVVNAFGDVRHPSTGEILAGLRSSPNSPNFADTLAQMRRGAVRRSFAQPARAGANTTLAVVATNARFERISLLRIAAMAQAGLARAVAPVHSSFDGDVVFALSLGRKRADVNTIGAAAAEAVARAIVRGVEKARGLGGVPALRELKRNRTRRRARRA